MRILDLKENQSMEIKIGRTIVLVKHCGFHSNGEALIGIEAPRYIPIWRGEVDEVRRQSGQQNIRRNRKQ